MVPRPDHPAGADGVRGDRPSPRPRLPRRPFLAGALAFGAAVVAPAAARPPALPGGNDPDTGAATAAADLSRATLMVAGPPDGTTRRWAQPVAEALHPGGPLSMQAIGGRDGVTAANEFESLASTDGRTALLVPGAAVTAWLAGDTRVHFDVGRWVAAFASDGPVVLFGRPLSGRGTLRVASSTPTGIELAARLALSLLGERPVAVNGLAEAADARDALLGGRVDAVMLSGPDLAGRLAELGRPGLGPLLSLDPRPRPAPVARPPAGHGLAALQDLPTLQDLYAARFGHGPRGRLYEAWRATALAASLQTALVLQPLTPAALVARWRDAGARAAADPALGAAAGGAGLRLLGAPDCVGVLSDVVASPDALLALRGWLNSSPV